MQKLPNLNTLEPQEGKLGKAFRNIEVRMNLQHPPKWIDGILKYHWIHKFKYLDGSGYFEIETDYNGRFVNKRNC